MCISVRILFALGFYRIYPLKNLVLRLYIHLHFVVLQDFDKIIIKLLLLL